MTITGTGFVPGSTVEWDGSSITTTYISATKLTAQLPATDTATATVGTVTVVNAAPGGGTSSPQFLYVVPAQVAIAATNLAGHQHERHGHGHGVGGRERGGHGRQPGAPTPAGRARWR